MEKDFDQIKTKNSLFQQFYEAIKSKENKIFKCKIIEEKEDKNLNIKFMSIIDSQNEISSSFIRDCDKINLKDRDICFEISNISLTLLNGIPYFLLKKYDIIENKNKSYYNFEQIRIYDSVDKIDKNNSDLCILILKAKEIFESLTKDSFIFEDLKGKVIKVEESDYNFEHGKIYIFKGYLYNNNKNIFEKTLISSIEEYSAYRDKVFQLKELDKMKEGMKVNFKAKIISFNIKDTFINIEDELGKKYKVNVNFSLLKKISLNQECTFLNFIKIVNNEFNFTNLSNIESKEDETFVEFNFLNYEDENTRFYNNIKIDDKLYKIDKKTIKIKINESSRKNLFIKKIFFERIENKESVHSFDYLFEINKGKNNHIEGFLGKDGYCYEFYIKSLQKEDLPKQISVTINDKIVNFKNPDKFSNEFQERFVLLNIPKQNINTIFNSSDKTIDSNSGKYLILIKSKNEKIIINFRKKINDIIKKDFLIPDNVSNEMKILYQKYINNHKNCINKYLDSKAHFPDLDTNKNISEIISKKLNIMLDGFNKYNFSNSKKDYDNVKYLSFIFIYHYLYKAKDFIYLFISNFEELLSSVVNLDYIDRIKVLIAFIINYYDNLFEEKYIKINNIITKKAIGPNNDFLILVNMDDDSIIQRYEYIKTAFEILYKIIDKLSEDCALFKIMQQINSLIHEEVLTNKKMHSGSILNLNDIKLELIQNIDRYLIISRKDRKYLDNYAFFRDISLTVTINIRSIMSIFSNNLNFNINNLVTVVLFLLIHESLGHKKKNINNENIDTPREYYGSNFEELSLDSSDTGLVLEKIIFGKAFEPKYLMENKNPQIFLNENLYLEKNFEKLHILYSELEKTLNLDDNIEKEKEKDIYDKDLKSKLNKSEKKLFVTNSDEEEKEEDPLLYHDLLAKYGDLTEDQKKENQDNIDYQLFLLMYKDRKQKKKYTLVK